MIQVFYGVSDNLDNMDYDMDDLESSMTNTFHDMSEVEREDNWARCW